MPIQVKLTALAAALRADREQLLGAWLGTLRIGMEKPGAVLSDDELRDHFGELLEDLCHQLEVPLTEASEITALKHAENHGDTRWTQGYRLPELIREVAALRTVVTAAVVAGFTHLSADEQRLANIIVHRFFDALVVESATFFATLSQDAAVLRERQHLAEEIHDGACQTLQSAVLRLATICSEADSRTAEQLNAVAALLKQGVEDIRLILRGLVGMIRKFEHGLPAALEELGAGISRGVPCRVCCDPGVEVPMPQAFHLFRIAQEAAGNACKHAGASSISIALRGTEDAFELEVQDDGSGFDPAAPTPSGIGLHNMQQRARAIGARLAFGTRPGAGTRIVCILPKAAATSN